ncbi:hypothetical protein BTO06_11745 [Tenacibaculum sp. SZ-18]|uniref:hypothetical protein n=1 Tax=Tenacibaculum sp. SZ-18 TaxID=754423 RepID=UPI000C2D4199|nr:hypothetical protein [Tenacibaculum sp. SZ-18]AUC15780.1 hypothetical protein BTO06_11745 [Tenacibaculum sp. SZ-18]
MIRKLLLILILTIIGQNSVAQNIDNPKLEKIITKIAKQEFLFYDYKLNKKSINLVNKLHKTASDDELIKLSKKDCKLCFSFSFWVLWKRNSDLIPELYNEYIEKNTEENFVEINEFNPRNKSCVKILMSEGNFIYEIYKEGKYLDKITAYNKGYN